MRFAGCQRVRVGAWVRLSAKNGCSGLAGAKSHGRSDEGRVTCGASAVWLVECVLKADAGARCHASQSVGYQLVHRFGNGRVMSLCELPIECRL